MVLSVLIFVYFCSLSLPCLDGISPAPLASLIPSLLREPSVQRSSILFTPFCTFCSWQLYAPSSPKPGSMCRALARVILRSNSRVSNSYAHAPSLFFRLLTLSGSVIAGHREGSMYKELKRVVPTAAALGGAILGLLRVSVGADLMGAPILVSSWPLLSFTPYSTPTS